MLLTKEMMEMWDKISPYFVMNEATFRYEFKSGTPSKIKELYKEFSRLWDEQKQREEDLLM